MYRCFERHIIPGNVGLQPSTPLFWKLGGLFDISPWMFYWYLTSSLSEIDLLLLSYKFLLTQAFPCLQMALPPNQMFKPETWEFSLTLPSPWLLLPIITVPTESILFFWDLSTSVARVLSPLPEPLQEAVLSLPAFFPPPTYPRPSFLCHLPPPLPTPTKSILLTAARIVFLNLIMSCSAQNASGTFLPPETWRRIQEHRHSEKALLCWDLPRSFSVRYMHRANISQNPFLSTIALTENWQLALLSQESSLATPTNRSPH